MKDNSPHGFIKTWLIRLYNGGVDPETLDAVTLRRRRTVALAASMMFPVALLLTLSNVYVGAYYDAIVVGTASSFALMIVYLLFRQVSTDMAANLAVGLFFGVITAIVIRTGLTGISWIWYIGVPLAASLTNGRKVGVIWTLVCITTAWLFALGHFWEIPWQGTLARPYIQVTIELTLLLATVLVISQGFLTAQEDAELALKGSLQQLRDEVAQRRIAESEAREAELAKSRFLTTMSHEIRTPMNGVLGATQLMSDTELTSEQRELLGTVQSSGEMLLDLINDVLDISKIDSGKLTLEQVSVHVDGLIGRLIAPMQMLIRDQPVKLDYEIDPDLPEWIVTDPTRLRQIVFNLVGNAVKFTANGSIQVRLIRLGDEFVIEVQDTGIGISPEAQERLFEPFVQADESTSRNYGGTGLGLSIVLKIVELFEGHVSLQSVPEHGSTFIVKLPLVAADAGAHDDNLRPDFSMLSKTIRVLLVDDNDINRMVARRMLEKLGHEVIEAHDGEEAVVKAQTELVNLILMDLQMPVMDGLQAATAIRQGSGINNSTPIIGLTANVGIEDKNAVLEAGMNAHLAKPIRVEVLKESIASHVRVA